VKSPGQSLHEVPWFWSALTRVERSADAVARLLGRHPYLALALATAAYAYMTVYRASRKLFWFDEIFTLYIVNLPDLRHVWRALMEGVDFNPPLFYILTRFAHGLFGQSAVASRLPEIVGFWIFCLCLFRFVSIRSSTLAGLISMGFPLVTLAYWYAYEARSHGAVLGFCGLALISWQAVTSGSRNRGWAALGLLLALACAVGTHSYAFLLFVPLVAGELVRSFVNRRLDWLVWSTLLAAGAAMLFSLPLVLAVRSSFGVGTVLPASRTLLRQWYTSLFEPAAPIIVIALILVCLDYVGDRTQTVVSDDIRRFQPHELVAVLAFLTIPCFSYLAARVSGAPMVGRYSLAAVAGLACLVGIAAAKRATIGLITVAALAVLITLQFREFAGNISITEPSSALSLSTSLEAFNQRYQWMSGAGHERIPIVLLDNLDFAPTFRYAPPDVGQRLVYLRVPGADFNSDGYEKLQRCCGAPGRIASLAELRATSDSFLAYGSSKSYYRVHEFAEAGGAVSIKMLGSDAALFLVTYPSRGR
jgi:hypothetical protein